MRFPRATRRLAFAFMFALGPSVACATGDDRPEATLRTPPPTDPPSMLDGGVDVSAEAGGPDASLARPECSADGFCYVSVPTPLNAVSASSVDDAWMVPTESDTLWHWDGTTLKPVYDYEGVDPPSITIRALWAQTKDNVWAFARDNDGRLVLVRYASPPGGGPPAFRELRTQQESVGISIWGTPAGDVVWANAEDGFIRVHEDASGAVIEKVRPSMGAEDSQEYRWAGVWGFGADDVYVAGYVCASSACDWEETTGVIGHFDGTRWSITTIDGSFDVTAFRGTRPGAASQLWFTSRERNPDPESTQKFVNKVYLVPVTSEGSLGAPLYAHSEHDKPWCDTYIGQAADPQSAWFSDGRLLCRWTGTKLEAARTALGSVPVVSSLNAIWAGGNDDVWIVGAAVTEPGQPDLGFAARRTAATADGGQP